jgi:hypothetical protein
MSRKKADYPVPARLVMDRFDTYVQQNVPGLADGTPHIKMHGLLEIVWPELSERKRIRRIFDLERTKVLSFDTADRILCAIDQNEAWFTDPELNAIYEEYA